MGIIRFAHVAQSLEVAGSLDIIVTPLIKIIDKGNIALFFFGLLRHFSLVGLCRAVYLRERAALHR